jgi:hypothetical protein
VQGVKPAAPDARQKSDLSKRFNLICPVQSPRKKYVPSLPTQITGLYVPSHPLEGRIAIVTDAGWDAVDAEALLTNSV